LRPGEQRKKLGGVGEGVRGGFAFTANSFVWRICDKMKMSALGIVELTDKTGAEEFRLRGES